ncbi:MAG: fibronectin type III domain-containing protein, partial [Bacteroidales bacterium]|nr:fibronectin type III domain-containing protein [Bacteroidales bacterium]
YQGNAFPGKVTYDGGEYYPLEARLNAPAGAAGKYLRFRFRMVTGSGHGAYPKCDWGCVYFMDVYESADCLTPTNLQSNSDNTTGTSIPVSWSDPNPAANKATAFELSYRKAYTGEDWQTMTVNTTNTTVPDLSPSTPYAFKLTAVCPTDNSLPSDSAVFNTLYGYAYKETMIEDTGYFYKIAGSNAYAKGRGPLERDVTSWTGTLPNSGNASLTIATDPISGEEVWGTKWGWEKWILSRRCPQSMGVCQTAQNAWLVTPVIENTTPRHAQVVRFKATAGWNSSEGSAPANWTLGSVNPSVYGNCTLQVLLSNNGKFTKNDVVGTLNISSYTDLIDKELEIKVPYSKAKTGRVQVALYFQNPNRQQTTQSKEVEDYMFFEIKDLEYLNDTCPEFEAGAELTPSDITTQEAKLTWPLLNVATYVLSWEPEDGSEEKLSATLTPEDIQVDETPFCSYKLTGLNENTAYKVTVIGYCDEEETMSTNELENTFTTLEACHTPTAFKVEDITSYGATFSSVNEQAIMVKRQVKVVSDDETYTHYFDQTENSLVLTDVLKDNMAYTAQTRSICENDTSKWSTAISFTTPEDESMVKDSFNITLQVRPEGAGTVEGAGRYEEDTEITMKAVANDGFIFKGWIRLAGDTVSRQANRRIQVKDDSTFIAVFRAQYTIDLLTQPTGTTGGTVTGAGTYEDGTEVTLTATPKTNYLFVAWVKAPGDTLSKNATHKFTPTASATYTAVFRAKQFFSLDVTVTPNADWGSVSFNPANEDDKYQEGREVTMTATPAQYCEFKGWVVGNDTVSKELSYKVTMDGNKTYKAVFAQIRYTVTLKSDPNTNYGTIKGTSGSTTTGGTFVAGTTRRLVAQAKSGYAFVKWMSGTKELGTDTVLTFVLSRDTTITAYFKEKEELDIKVNIEPANTGTVTGAGKVKRGENAVLKAIPAAHYAFKEWRRLDNSTVKSNPYTFKPERDYTFTAVFRALEQYTVTVDATEGGSVSGAGTFEEGASVSLTATADENYYFAEWQDADGNTLETDETYTFTVTGNTTVKAVFTENDKYTVTLQRSPSSAAGTVIGAGSYHENDEVTIKATANKGYKFLYWTKKDGTQVTDNPYTFNALGRDMVFTAVFEALINITVTVDPEDAGTVTGAGTFEENDEVTLTANPDNNYLFVEWQEADGTSITTDNPYVFNATASKSLKAVFREKGYFSIDVPCVGDDEDENDPGTVSIPGGEDGEWQEGQTVTMTATPAQYYEFVEWQDKDGNTLSTNATYTFVITQDTTFTAVFSRLQYTVTLVSNPSKDYGTINGTSGSVSDGGTFDAGSKRHLEAKPKSGYEFVKWMSGNIL